MSFLVEDILNLFVSDALIIVLWSYHGNKIDKLGKMISSQFPTEAYITNCECCRINATIHSKSSLEQSSSLHNQLHDTVNPKHL